MSRDSKVRSLLTLATGAVMWASSTAAFGAPGGGSGAPELEGIHITADEFALAVADLMEDQEAKRTIEAGAGNLTGMWAVNRPGIRGGFRALKEAESYVWIHEVELAASEPASVLA